MTKAKPSTEQAIKGQMGQPAACMMASKTGLLADTSGVPGVGAGAIMAYGVLATRSARGFSVDNFVNKTPA
jgi:hypothetical protein